MFIGHGHWLSIERFIAERSESAPLTIERIQSTISEAGGAPPAFRSVTSQIATDLDSSPKGKTREAYELFWAKYKSEIPLSVMTRLSDIDDCEQHVLLKTAIAEWAKSEKKPREALRFGLTRTWHIFLRVQAVKASSGPAQGTEELKMERLFQLYRANWRFADLLFDGAHGGLVLPNGWTSANVEGEIFDHFEQAWNKAREGGLLVRRRIEKLDPCRDLAHKEALLILRALFDVGAASAAEQIVSLALVQKDRAKIAEWSSKLKNLLAEKVPVDRPAVTAALDTLSKAFKERRAVQLARDRLAFVMASCANPAGGPGYAGIDHDDAETIMTATRNLNRVSARMRDNGDWKWLAPLPSFANLKLRNPKLAKEVEDALRQD